MIQTGVKVHSSGRQEQDKWTDEDDGSSSAGRSGLYGILLDERRPL